MVHDLLDQTHVLQSPHGLSGQRTVDLHSLDEDRLGDHLVGRDLLEDLVAVKKKKDSSLGYVCGLVEEIRRDLLNVLGGLVDHDGVVGLVLDLTLGPLLLLTRDVGIASESACKSIATERQSA